MNALRPIPTGVLLVGLVSVAALTSCGAPGPQPSGSAPQARSPTAPAETVDLGGLIVAADGALQITDQAGALVALTGPPEPIVDVSAGGERILAVDQGRTAWTTADSGDAPAWQQAAAPDLGDAPMLAAVAPDGSAIAFAVGTPQGRTFRLEVRQLDPAKRTVLEIDRGLDGLPIWLGPTTIAIRTLGRGDEASFSLVDVTTGTTSDVVASGITVAASGDGERVAMDDQATGEVFVGPRAAWLLTGLEGLARFGGPNGAGVERLALSRSGERLAVAYRSDAGVSIEILVETAGAWRSAGTIAIAGAGAIAIAWRS